MPATIRICTPGGTLEMSRSFSPSDGVGALDAWSVESVLTDAVQARRIDLPSLARALEWSGPLCVTAIAAAVAEGRIEARFERRPVIVAPRTPTPALGPSSSPPPPPSADAWLAVQLFDAEGAPVAGIACEITPPGEERARPKSLDADGQATVDGIEDGTGRVVFRGLKDRDGAPLDDEAADPRPIAAARSITRVGAIDRAFSVPTGATHVFQLRRPVVEVIELEHFHPGSAVFQPGPSPWDPAHGPRGIDVLRMALRHAATFPVDRVRIVGHVASNHPAVVSAHRAAIVRALLVGDRDAFVSAARAAHVSEDERDLLDWAAPTFGWPCAPGSSTSAALKSFQRSYAAQPWGEPISPTGAMDDATWGAFFVCIERVLTGVQPPPVQRGTTPAGRPIGPAYLRCRAGDSFAPITLAKDAKGSETFYTELTPLNPHLVYPNDAWKRNIYKDDEINLPDDWLDNGVLGGKYEIHDKEPEPPPADAVSLLRDPPKTAACGSRHLTHPFDGAPERRNVQRHVEVIFFGPDEATNLVCTFDGDCNHSTCWLYDPKEYTHVFRPADASETPTIDPTWLAQWDAPTVSRSGERTMSLTAPDLPAGEEVEFEVFQVGVGSIGKTTAVSEAGKASAKWSDWFHPSRATAPVALQRGEPFPSATFHFTATAVSSTAATVLPVVYEDELRVRIVYDIDGTQQTVSRDKPYVVCTAWGSRPGVTSDGWIDERDVPPGGASIVLGKKTLVRVRDGGRPMTDAQGAVGDSTWARFFDAIPDAPRLTVVYCLMSPYPAFQKPASYDDFLHPPPVRFRLRRWVPVSAPLPTDVVQTIEDTLVVAVDDVTLSPDVVCTNPWGWSIRHDVCGGEGWVEVTLLAGDEEVFRDRITIGYPVEER